MARGRMISTSLSTSERRARLNDVAGRLAEFCQALYPLMVVHADDFGRHPGDPFTVRHVIDPTSRRTLDEFARALTFLDEVGLIRWYVVEDKQFYEIVAFQAHQSGLHKRTRSRYPGFAEQKSEFREIPGNSRKFPEIPAEEKGTEEKRTPPVPPSRGGRRRRGAMTDAEAEHIRKTQEVKRLIAEGLTFVEASRQAGFT